MDAARPAMTATEERAEYGRRRARRGVRRPPCLRASSSRAGRCLPRPTERLGGAGRRGSGSAAADPSAAGARARPRRDRCRRAVRGPRRRRHGDRDRRPVLARLARPLRPAGGPAPPRAGGGMIEKPHRFLLDRVSSYGEEGRAYLRRRRMRSRPFARVRYRGGRGDRARSRQRARRGALRRRGRADRRQGRAGLIAPAPGPGGTDRRRGVVASRMPAIDQDGLVAR